MLHPGEFGDVLSQVAHPLQITHRTHGRDHHPQIGGYRCLQDEQRDAALVHVLAQHLKLPLARDDRLGELKVGMMQCDGSVGHHLPGEAGGAG
jgi:hypothetical protein